MVVVAGVVMGVVEMKVVILGLATGTVVVVVVRVSVSTNSVVVVVVRVRFFDEFSSGGSGDYCFRGNDGGEVIRINIGIGRLVRIRTWKEIKRAMQGSTCLAIIVRNVRNTEKKFMYRVS